MKKLNSAKDLEKFIQKAKEKQHLELPTIVVSSGTCGRARGSEKVFKTFEKLIKRKNLKDKLNLRSSGCHGFCEAEPNVIIFPGGANGNKPIFYQKLTPEDVEAVIEKTVLNNEIIDRLRYEDPLTKQKFTYYDEIPFYKKQYRLISGNNVFVDPTDINDYFAIGGYRALAKALTMSPEDIIAEVKKSGLRGRGGAGFPTGLKWEFCRKQKGDEKYIICNADEGDPGAYMDRSLLEGNPHCVIEGMIIGGYAIGAKQGIVYVRTEYPLAIENLKIALDQAKKSGLLGENILGSGFNFDITIARGAGAFVCGEETALIASIEGRIGEPRQRPPYPAEKGLWGKPTNINNVETWGTIPTIINQGAEKFSAIGTEKSKGTKIFSLVGKVRNTGLVEVPMGITLREIIFDIGGGIPENKQFKAVQTGGPSGGCMPKELLDLQIDYEGLTAAGSMMGSGGMIVMDENTCMVDVAKYFLNFLRDESCGKCFSCREGTQRMYEIVSDITEGKGQEGDIEFLKEVAQMVKDASMCGLGQTAANPVLSTLRYFEDEYLAHIKDKKCPAGVCKTLIKYLILPDKCTGCMKCIKVCPQNAISGERKKVHTINQELCIKCGICKDTCPFKAIIIE
ncbi:MAG: NADH-quinone oxidoreductase subunit NuoF [candidate division WOR-3 bacterium]|nr:NADH-quinone oxidoreductase subunit NuoF [candidate division WOR-3 bacterium]